MPVPAHRTRAAAVLAAACMLLAATAAAVQAATITPATADTAPAGPLSETDALARAAATGQPVTADALTTPTDTTVANPDGTLTLTRTMAPIRTRAGGRWVDLDATLHANGDGTFSPTAALGQVAFSGGGTGPAVTSTLEGRTIALTAPMPLPAPTIAGDAAVYPQILPGVDLRLRAQTDGGFKQVLIVHDRTAAANPALATFTFALRTDGLTLAAKPDGSLRGTAAGRTVLTTPSARMWDSTTTDAQTGQAASTPDGPGAGARTAPVGLQVGAGTLTLTPDPALLASADATYPIYVDPPFNPSSTGPVMDGWATVSKNFPSSNYWKNTPDPNGNMQVGNSGSIWSHTLIRFPIPVSTLAGATILSADFKITEVYSYSCTPKVVNVYAPSTNLTSSNANWNYWDGVSLGTAVASANVAYGYNSTCDRAAVHFDVKTKIASDVAASKTLQTFVMTAVNESSDLFGYKEFLATSPTLQITYNHPPNKPTGLTTSPATACTGTPTVIGQGPVTLNAPVSDPNGGALDVDFTLTKSGNSTDLTGPGVVTATSGASPAVLAVTQATLDTAAGATQTTFTWQARATDGSVYGPWSDPCTFVYDPTRPGAPTVTVPATTITIGISFDATITAPSGPAPSAYYWRLNTDPPTRITYTGTSMTIPVTPTRRVNTLTVTAVSAGGNISDQTAITTFDSNPAQTAVDSDLTGDGYTDAVAVGDVTNGLPPGLWLAAGTASGSVNAMAANIGVNGTNADTAGSPADYTGMSVITGRFFGTGFQDVIAYDPTTTIGAVIAGNGDGSALRPQYAGSQFPITANTFADRNDDYDPTTNPQQIVNGYNITGSLDSYPDLLSINGSTGNYHLDYHPSAGTAQYDYPTVLPTLTPTGGSDWNNWTLATTEINNTVWMFLRNKTVGSLYLWKDVHVDPGSGTLTYIDPATGTPSDHGTGYILKTSGWNTGTALTLLAEDLNGDINNTPDLRTVGAGADVTSYLVSGLSATPTIAASTDQTLNTGTHAWPLADKPDGTGAGSPVTATRDDIGTPTTLTATAGSTGVTWTTGDLFDPAINLAGTTNSHLTTTAPAFASDADFSVSVWAKPTAAGGTVFAQDGTNTAAVKLWADTSDNSWRLALSQTNTTGAVWDTAIAPPGSFQPNLWTQLTVSFQKTPGIAILTINGVNAASTPHTTLWNATGSFRLGSLKTGATIGSYLTGQIARVQTWATPLTIGNIAIRCTSDVQIYGANADGTLTDTYIDPATGDIARRLKSTATLGFTPAGVATLNPNTLLITSNGHLYRVDILSNTTSLTYTTTDVGGGPGWTFTQLAYDGTYLYGITAGGQLNRYKITTAKPAYADITDWTTISTGFTISNLTATAPAWILGTTSTGTVRSYKILGASSWLGYTLGTWTGLTAMYSPGGGLYYTRDTTNTVTYRRDTNPTDGIGTDITLPYTTDPVTTTIAWTETALSAQPGTCTP